MCGRFIFIPQDELNEIIADVQRSLQTEKRANASAAKDVYPKATVPIVLPNHSQLEVKALQWGYPVHWQRDVVFNTRADSAKKGMWADSVEHRRCLVPSFGFYEPHKFETTVSAKTGRPIKQQYFFQLPDTDILMMGGIWEGDHFSIMTTEPNEWMEPIHKRMPVVLRADEWGIWLGPEYEKLYDRKDVVLVSKAV